MKLKGGPTQDEIMAVSLFKLRIPPGGVLADIGCGTGKVAVAAAAQAGRVLAIDRRPEAIACTRAEIERSGVENIQVIEGEARDILADIDRLDGAFIGGTGDLEGVLALLASRVRGFVVINAVLLESVHCAVAAMQELGIFCEVVHIQVSRSHGLAGGMMLKPLNPVYIIVGRCG